MDRHHYFYQSLQILSVLWKIRRKWDFLSKNLSVRYFLTNLLIFWKIKMLSSNKCFKYFRFWIGLEDLDTPNNSVVSALLSVLEMNSCLVLHAYFLLCPKILMALLLSWLTSHPYRYIYFSTKLRFRVSYL